MASRRFDGIPCRSGTKSTSKYKASAARRALLNIRRQALSIRKLAVQFNERRILRQKWQQWHNLCSSKSPMADHWRKSFLLQKSLGVWVSYCHIMKELCEAGERLHQKRLKLLVFSCWKDYANATGDLGNIYLKKLVFRALKNIAVFKCSITKIGIQRRIFLARKCYQLWQNRFKQAVLHRAIISQCQKTYKIHLLSLSFQGFKQAAVHASIIHQCQKSYQRHLLSASLQGFKQAMLHAAIISQFQKTYQSHQLSIILQGWHDYTRTNAVYHAQLQLCRKRSALRLQLSVIENWRVNFI